MSRRGERELESEPVHESEPERSGPSAAPAPLSNQAVLRALDAGQGLPVPRNERDPRITEAARGRATAQPTDPVMARALATAARDRATPEQTDAASAPEAEAADADPLTAPTPEAEVPTAAPDAATVPEPEPAATADATAPETEPATAAAATAPETEPATADAAVRESEAAPAGPVSAVAEGGAEIEEAVVDAAELESDEPALRGAPAGPTLARSLVGDAWNKAKGVAGAGVDLVASKLSGPLERLSSGLTSTLPPMEQRVAEAGEQVEPGTAQAIAPADAALETVPAEHDGMVAESRAGELAGFQAAELAGAPHETGQIEACPAEPEQEGQLSIGVFKEGEHGIAGEMLEGAIFGDFQEDQSGWGLVGQLGMSFVPYAGQVADARDIGAAIVRLNDHGWHPIKNFWDYANLGLAIAGIIPGLKEAIKAFRHIGPDGVMKGVRLLKSTLKTGWDGAGKAIKGLKAGGERLAQRAISSGTILARKAADRARRAGSALKAKVQSGVEKGKRVLQGAGRKIGALASNVRSKAQSGVDSAKRLLGKAKSVLPGPVRGLVDRIGAGAKRAISAAGQHLARMRAKATTIGRKLAEKARQAATRAKELAEAAKRRAVEVRTRVQTWVKQRGAAIGRRVSELAAKGKAVLKKTASTVVETTKQAIVGQIKRATRNLRQTLEKGLKQLLLDAGQEGVQHLDEQQHAREPHRVLDCSGPQLQDAYSRYAADFDASGDVNAYKAAVNAHVENPATQPIEGEYQGGRATHFADPTTGRVVTRDERGAFVSGRKLDPAQLQELQATGKLNAG